MGIIKFIDNKNFILILIQITVSRNKEIYGGVNIRFKKDLNYIIAKLEYFLPGYHCKSAHLIYMLDKMNENLIPQLNELNKIEQKEKNLYKESKNCNNANIIEYKYKIPKDLEKNVHIIFFSRKFLNFFNYEGKMIKELKYLNDNIQFTTSDSNHYFSLEYLQKIFDKILKVFNVIVGKYYINVYDNNDINGNFLIMTKLSSNHLTITINIKGKKLQILKVVNNEISNAMIDSNDNEERISYFFEIINPDNVKKISLFEKIIID